MIILFGIDQTGNNDHKRIDYNNLDPNMRGSLQFKLGRFKYLNQGGQEYRKKERERERKKKRERNK